MIVFPQYLNGAEAATIKERELLSKQSSKAGSVSDIVIKPNHIIKITIVRNPPKNLKVRNVTKLNQEGTLHWVAADGNVKAGTLLPLHFDWWGIKNFRHKFLALGVIANTTLKFDERAAFTQQRVVITYRVANYPRLITGMQSSECIVDHLLKF
jgi:hypothetical protein